LQPLSQSLANIPGKDNALMVIFFEHFVRRAGMVRQLWPPILPVAGVIGCVILRRAPGSACQGGGVDAPQ
jgi:hypothetical protein